MTAVAATGAGEWVRVHVKDDLDERTVGHQAVNYLSPPQPLEQALELVRAAGIPTATADGASSWQTGIPCGRRIVSLIADAPG